MSAAKHRLAEGGRIDRDRPITFHFNGRQYRGHAGDTLASALLANGVHLVARSFKYHRPRGIFSAGSEEPNALIQLETGARTQPNLRATQVELYEGLKATSINCWPGPGFDVGAINNLLSPLLPAGFYYKTFMWPGSFWHLYEDVIRRAAGLGRAPTEPDPDRYEKNHVHCDVLIAGGGPAGLAAALAAGRTGARVIVADEQAEFGGALLGNREVVNGKPGGEWVAEAVAELAGMAEVTLLPRATVLAYFDHNYLTICERVTDHLGPAAPPEVPRQRLWKLRAKQVVLATGAHERPLVFRDNDRPGVMLASAARTYVNRYGVRPGRRAVICTNNDSAYGAALDLANAGVKIAALVDLRPEPAGALPDALRAAGIELIAGHAVTGTGGTRHLSSVELGCLRDDGAEIAGGRRTLKCDLLAVSGGWNPALHLLSQSRGRLNYDEAKACFVPGQSAQSEQSAGACNASFALAHCLAEGHAAGAAAAESAGFSPTADAPPAAEPSDYGTVRAVVPIPSRDSRAGKQFVDLQNDVTAADVALAAREGYRSVEHTKRYTTLGMGTDQGKTANVNGLAILSQALDKPIPDVGTTTFRPPYTPTTFGALAGRDVGALADPERMTPMHHWHVRVGAVFEDVGQWKRPYCYPRGDESKRDAVNRECLAVRETVGILDASTLGKIDIQGPDARKLLNIVYTNAWNKLGVGHCRYGLMLGEDGMIFDDGVTSRLDEDRYLMTTTTGNAARVLDWLEEWLQTEWPDWRVYCTSVTEQFATMTVCGPKARDLLAELTDDIDLDPAAFPFMSWRAGTVAGIPARVFKISFTGENSYEINVPANFGMAVWTAIMTAGEKYGITPFGTEAMHVLRAEKGFVIVGQETDATVTPHDLGMDWAVSKTKDFIGKRSFIRPDTARHDRKQLVGLLTDAPDAVLPEGGQIVAEPGGKPPVPMIGHVTSSYFSAALGRSIALALVKGGRARHGETVHIPLLDGGSVAATITEPRFYDLEGERLRG